MWAAVRVESASGRPHTCCLTGGHHPAQLVGAACGLLRLVIPANSLNKTVNPDSVLGRWGSDPPDLSSFHLPTWLMVPLLYFVSASAVLLPASTGNVQLPHSVCVAPSCLTTHFCWSEFCSYFKVLLRCHLPFLHGASFFYLFI